MLGRAMLEFAPILGDDRARPGIDVIYHEKRQSARTEGSVSSVYLR